MSLSPPENWEDFPKLDDELKKQGAHAIFWDYTTPYYSYALISANGGYAFRKGADGRYDVSETGIANEGAKKGLRFLADLVRGGHMDKGPDYAVMEENFAKGNLGCIVAGPWALGVFKDAGIDYSFNRLPKLDGKRSRPFVGILGFTINSASPNRKLAVDFLENYLLTDEGLKEVNDDKPLGASALKSFQQILSSNPVVETAIENAREGDLMPSVPEMSKFWPAFSNALKNATTGRQSADDALDEAAKQILMK